MSVTCEDTINEDDVVWALESQGMILENNKTELADNKKLAIHRLLRSIHRIDYQCLNKPLRWEDNSGEHKGFYHPMDLLHFLIKNLDIPSRSKLYQKLSLCKLAVPVLFQDKGHVYMDMSLSHVKTTWINEGHNVEGNVANAPVALFSLIRCGKQSVKYVSKSMLANYLFNFKREAELGSCGFFSRYSASNSNFRKVAEGTVEGLWYEATSDNDEFPASFGLLNLRGDTIHNIEAAATVASTSDILFMFCGKDMLKDDGLKNLIQETKKKLSVNRDCIKKIKKIVFLYPKDQSNVVKKSWAQLQEICETEAQIKFKNKFYDKNYQKLLVSIKKHILNHLNQIRKEVPYPLSNRLRNENKESSKGYTESTKHINDLLLKMMYKIKNADENTRSKLRVQLFPLQSTMKDYAQTQREENRSTDVNTKSELADKLIVKRDERFSMIKNGLSDVISAFLKELLNAKTDYQKLMIVYNIQYALDDWCVKHLLDKRMQYNKLLSQMMSRKEEESINSAETKNCENLAKLLLDMSVGIENIFREISEIHDTIKINDGNLIEELDECNKKLPELVAILLMKGVSVELLDGDGLSVPTEWLELVLKSLEKCLKEAFSIIKSPKIFVVTVLGTQSTGKSTLLNTMFGVRFPVSAGRCTKGAFMQFVPIRIDDFPYDGILIIDTEGLGAPEYRQDNTHDNEIATFVLGISDLVLINIRGEVPTNIENFLQVSTCALMRMSMVDFRPSVVFVHQNCDPSSKVKNLEARHSFMKLMDEAVSTQAKLIQKQDRFRCFRDVVNVSLSNEENDFVYFPQLLEGASPMSPPSVNYSQSCFQLLSCILNKMKKNFQQFHNQQTLGGFAEKVKLVWKGVLDENFVLSLTNSAEIQVKYDIDNWKCNWKREMETHMEDVLKKLSREVEADFKAKEPTEDLLCIKEDQLKVESNSTNDKQKKKFCDCIRKQKLHEKIYGNWEEKTINKMDQIREQIMEDCQKRLRRYYNHEKNESKWKNELQQSKYKLQQNARKIANELLDRKEKDETPEFTSKEIEDEFEKFWSSVKQGFFSKRETTYVAENPRTIFVQEIGEKYGGVPGYKEILEKFGLQLQNNFKPEWVEISHFEFIDDKKISDYEFLKEINHFIASIRSRISAEVIYLSNAGDFMTMKFRNYSTIFNSRYLVKEYLEKVEKMLTETHEKLSLKTMHYNLTDTFKVIFLYFAAQIAIPNFEKAQKSFIDYMDNSTKLDRDRKDIKELFRLILKKEGIFTIAAKQITKILHQKIKDAVLADIRIHCKDILLRLVTQKIHIHGLVLHDVIAMLDNIDDEKVKYIQEYFHHPFDVFEKKILHVFDSCQDIRLNDIIREKFDAAVKKIKQSLEYDLQTSCQKSLTEVMCQNQLIIWLGIGEKDFAGILMPNFNGGDASSIATLSNPLPKNEDKKNKVKKLITAIAETDEVNTEISIAQQEEIKRQVISDASNHLFECTSLCPLCLAPCNETHSEREGVDSTHSSRCHRPQGFATYVKSKSAEFVTLFCNDLIKSKEIFKNPDTNDKWVFYRDYKKVNSYYESWNIEAIAGADSIYWKYITYHVTKNLDRYFPNAKKADVSQWGKITKSEAIKNINSLFHLDGNTIARNKYGFHIIKTSEYLKSTLDFLGEEKKQFKDHNNIVETQAKYDIDNHKSGWVVEIENYKENFHKNFLKQAEIDFETKEPPHVKRKKHHARTDSHCKSTKQKHEFRDYANSAETQVTYDIDNSESNWKEEMEKYMEDLLEKLLTDVDDDFKTHEPTQDRLRIKENRLKEESIVIYNKQKQKFRGHIQKQPLHKAMDGHWEQTFINKMDQIRGQILEDCQRRLSTYHNQKKNEYKWENELERRKHELQAIANTFCYELLERKGKNQKSNFTNEEIEEEFERCSVKENFNSKIEATYVGENPRIIFVQEIGENMVVYQAIKKFLRSLVYNWRIHSRRNGLSSPMLNLLKKTFQKLMKKRLLSGVLNFLQK